LIEENRKSSKEKEKEKELCLKGNKRENMWLKGITRVQHVLCKKFPNKFISKIAPPYTKA
jgi:hypothetical protein